MVPAFVFQLDPGGHKFTPRPACSTHTPGRHASASRSRIMTLSPPTAPRTDIAERPRSSSTTRPRTSRRQERREPVVQGRSALAQPAQTGHERHADREPHRRTLVDFRVPEPGHARQRHGLQAVHQRRRIARPDRPHLAGQGAAAVRPPPDQAAGRPGPPREDRADPVLRHGGRSEAVLRRVANPLPRRALAQGYSRAKPVEDRGPRRSCGSIRPPATRP